MTISELKVSRPRPSVGNPFCTSNRSNSRLLPATDISNVKRIMQKHCNTKISTVVGEGKTLPLSVISRHHATKYRLCCQVRAGESISLRQAVTGHHSPSSTEHSTGSGLTYHIALLREKDRPRPQVTRTEHLMKFVRNF